MPILTAIPERLIIATRALAEETAELRFAPPVHTIYTPLVYAREPAERYIARYAGKCRALLVGMNPGPFGMAQTGVPFGEVSLVREWLRIAGTVEHPPGEHPRRPVRGFSCPRSEVSGRRLWGFFRERFATPDDFFKVFFVTNYCPLVFMEESGRNLTPDKLPAAERAPLYAACDRYLQTTVALLEPEFVIGVGAFAAKRIKEALSPTPRTALLASPPQRTGRNRATPPPQQAPDASIKVAAPAEAVRREATLTIPPSSHARRAYYRTSCPGRDAPIKAVRVAVIPHPSPASPQANLGWSALAERALAELGLLPK